MTLKEQIRNEFEKEFIGVYGERDFSEIGALIQDGNAYIAFLDQAYDRIREESLREALKNFPERSADDCKGADECEENIRAAIQSLITKK